MAFYALHMRCSYPYINPCLLSLHLSHEVGQSEEILRLEAASSRFRRWFCKLRFRAGSWAIVVQI